MTGSGGTRTGTVVGKTSASGRPGSLKKWRRSSVVGVLAVLVAAVMLLTGMGVFGADVQAAVIVDGTNPQYSLFSVDNASSFSSPHGQEAAYWRTGRGSDRMTLVGISWYNGLTQSTIESVTWTPRISGSGPTIHLTEVQTHAVSRATGSDSSALRYAGTAIYAWPTGTTVPGDQEGYLTVTFSDTFYDMYRYVTLGMVNFSGVDQTTPLGAAAVSSDASGNTTVSVDVDSITAGMVFDSVACVRTDNTNRYLVKYSPDQILRWTEHRTQGPHQLSGAASTRPCGVTGTSTLMRWTASTNLMWAQAAVALRPSALTYTIRASVAGSGGSISPDTKTVGHGEASGDFTITPDPGYELDTLTDTGPDVTAQVSAAGTYSIASVTRDHELVVTFKKIQYALTYTAGPGGSITGDTSQTVAYGDSGTEVTAVADTGYHFVKWSDDVPTATRTDTDVQGDITVAAEFAEDAPAPDTYTLTYTAGSGGIITGATTQTVEAGDDGTEVTAVADTGYRFVKWSDGLTTAARTDTDVQRDITVTAIFAEDTTYTLSYSAGTGGIITGATPQTVKAGDDGSQVTAVAATGYRFVKWSDDVTTAARTDKNIAESLSVTAEFVEDATTITHILAYSAGIGGIITGDATQTVEAGGDGSEVTAVAATGYHFVKWSDGLTTAARTDKNTAKSMSVTAEFAQGVPVPVIYTLTYSAGPGGTITGVTPQTVEAGSDGTAVTAVPATGYHFVKWSDGFPNATRMDTNIRGNISVTAEFAADQQPPQQKDRWSDIPDSDWQRVYGISVDQAYDIAQGYGDGTFRPREPLARAHCAKMIVDGFGVSRLLAAIPTFSDVGTSHPQYGWIEGGYAAKVVNGYTDGTFRPGDSISRQQFNSMLARVLVQREIKVRGGIRGADGHLYGTLVDWYAAEGARVLAAFADADKVHQDHKANTAYLVFKGVVQGGERQGLHYLDPLTNLKRAQAVAMIVRAGLVAGGF